MPSGPPRPSPKRLNQRYNGLSSGRSGGKPRKPRPSFELIIERASLISTLTLTTAGRTCFTIGAKLAGALAGGVTWIWACAGVLGTSIISLAPRPKSATAAAPARKVLRLRVRKPGDTLSSLEAIVQLRGSLPEPSPREFRLIYG